MKLKSLLIIYVLFLTSNCFAYNYSYNVFQEQSDRKGFESNKPIKTYRSETYGDTTYHTLYPTSPRKGFSG